MERKKRKWDNFTVHSTPKRNCPTCDFLHGTISAPVAGHVTQYQRRCIVPQRTLHVQLCSVGANHKSPFSSLYTFSYTVSGPITRAGLRGGSPTALSSTLVSDIALVRRRRIRRRVRRLRGGRKAGRLRAAGVQVGHLKPQLLKATYFQAVETQVLSTRGQPDVNLHCLGLSLTVLRSTPSTSK